MNNNFISATKEKCSFDKHIPAPYMRKVFILDFIPEKAELSICGLGFYGLYINGREITKGALAPYISNPDHYCYFDTYDVKALLGDGENVIGIILGNGFNNPFGGVAWGFDKAPWIGAPRVALEFTAENGEERLYFTADESFKTHFSPIIFDELRMGEHYDANKEIKGWNEPGFDDSEWKNAIVAETPRGELKKCEAEPIKIIKEIKPLKIFKSKNGYIYDFGENNAGLCRLTINAQKNQKIEIYHAELLADGELDRSSIGFNRPELGFYKEYNHKDIYIAKGVGEEIYIPRFTYHGFRYAEARGISEEQATNELLTYCIMRSDIKKIGHFSCSDETVNRLYKMTKISDEANFFYFPTDCPHREKNGWTGDASISADHMALLYDVSASWHEWLHNIRKAQGDDGRLPGFIPNYDAAYDWGNGPAWDSVIFNLPYTLYRMKGDLEFIKENASAMIRYLEYVINKREEDGTVNFGLGDFMPVGDKCNTDYTTPVVLTNSIVVMDMARKAAEMFDAVGYTHHANFAHGIYEDIRNVIRTRLINLDTKIALGESQTGQAMAIYYGVFERDEEQEAFEHLMKYIHEKNDSFDCGCLGLHTIFHVLSDFGEGELAYKMITKKDFPSYAYFIELGETCLVESFKSHGRCGSHNHHFFGDIARWFINRLAGLLVVDSEHIEIKPDFIKSLEFASASLELPKGKVSVSWQRVEDKIKLDINCCDGVEYKIKLPGGYAMENNTVTIKKDKPANKKSRVF